MSLWRDVLTTLERWWLGETPADVLRIIISAMVMYLVALWIVRSGKKRFLGRNTVFDALLAFIMGGVLSRAINGGAAWLSTALAGFTLMGMHWLFGVIALRSHTFGVAVKGGMDKLVEDGRTIEDNLEAHHITENDLLVAARGRGIEDVAEIEAAYFERNGTISIVPKRRIEIVEIDVEEGVQKVRLAIAV